MTAPSHVALLEELATKWERERATAHPADAMLINKKIRELRETIDAIALMRAPVGVVGEVVEIGDDDEGRPRILIHTTRESIKNGPPLAFRTVQVSAMQQTTKEGGD